MMPDGNEMSAGAYEPYDFRESSPHRAVARGDRRNVAGRGRFESRRADRRDRSQGHSSRQGARLRQAPLRAARARSPARDRENQPQLSTGDRIAQVVLQKAAITDRGAHRSVEVAI